MDFFDFLVIFCDFRNGEILLREPLSYRGVNLWDNPPWFGPPLMSTEPGGSGGATPFVYLLSQARGCRLSIQQQQWRRQHLWRQQKVWRQRGNAALEGYLLLAP